MEQITVEKIIEIHDEVILNYDGASGILFRINMRLPGVPAQSAITVYPGDLHLPSMQ